MFLKYLDFIFAPFRAINNKIIGVKNIKGNIQVDVNRIEGAGADAARTARATSISTISKLNQAGGQAAAAGSVNRCSKDKACQGHQEPRACTRNARGTWNARAHLECPGAPRDAERESADPHDGVLDLQEEVLHAVRAAARQELGRLSVLRADRAQAAIAAPAKRRR